jgi:hypothetical protein
MPEIDAPFTDDFGVEIHCVYSHLRHPQELKPNPDNPNRHSAHQISLLASIIQEQGWRAPVTVSNRSGLVVRGHGRLEAALLLGLTQVPVDAQDYETEADELADLVADNRLSELAEMDEGGLKTIMEKIRAADPDFDRELQGAGEAWAELRGDGMAVFPLGNSFARAADDAGGLGLGEAVEVAPGFEQKGKFHASWRWATSRMRSTQERACSSAMFSPRRKVRRRQ